MDDDDFFSDDDLAAIPADTLRKLEEEAVLKSTQATRATSVNTAPPPLRKQAHTATSLNRPGSVNRNLPWRPPQPSRPSQPKVPSAPPASAPRPPSSDYGYDDEDVIDLDEPSMVIQPASRPAPVQPQYQQQQKFNQGSRQLDPETAAAFAAADQELNASQTFGRWQQAQPVQNARAGPVMDLSTMQARIAELEAEQARLRQAEHQAREEARLKAGEIAIVRSNQEKAAKQYETRLAVMQRLHAEETAKAKAEIEAQRKEREKMQTDNRFLQHDLARESERAKRGNVPVRSKATQQGTPRKGRKAARGDGFDDDEVRLASPSRSFDRNRSRGEHTPKAGAKRKRPTHDSPVALSFTQPPQALRTESTEQTAASFGFNGAGHVVIKEDTRYEFMQLILNHCPHEGHDATVESLAKYSFPSNPSKTLSSIFIHDISYASTSEDCTLPLIACRALLKLWARCLEDKFFAPFYLLLDLLRFILRTERASVRAQLLEEAIPLCSRTIDFIAVPLSRAAKNPTFAASMDMKAFDELAEELDVERVMEFLHSLCFAATLVDGKSETFWNTIDFAFTLQMLGKAQPISQIVSVLQMLSTSTRELTFGAISSDTSKQRDFERATVERLTNLLFETPEAPSDEAPYSVEEIMELRLEVIKVFRALCYTDHGGLLLVQQRSAVGRFVRFLDAQMARLYKARPTIGMPPNQDNLAEAHDLIIASINMVVRILHHLIRAYEGTLEIVPKLHAVHGGYHKFLVSLTRVAFSEQLCFEAGIEDEVAEAAHNILDNVLGPEDGDAIMRAIETPRGTRGSSTEKATTSGGRGDSQRDDDTTMSEVG
ncbi:hypothetical protein CB0940_03661 [Cercospora beticola]|uniref:DNA repair protein rad26 n=1 Tax=Cercospora beticola TaxID=122368 RepID=A0A2G5I4V8_CERBT|nr:hypothetical protein CB0940_03661 [Cercospora beticola]PIA99839.1 hypothetical protein CB0940_03661 [Cercospora beticola]WPB00841.1 hypothetical protein RHO25_005461 [Cercospora beticola]